MSKVLIVDDDPVQLRLTSEVAKKAGFDVSTASGGLEALSLLRTDKTIRAMVLDLVMPDLDGMAVMETMAREEITVPVIVQTASSSLDIIVSSMRIGASDYFVKPVAPERLTISLRNAMRLDELESCLRTERARHTRKLGFKDIIARSSETTRALELAHKAAKSNIPVLIEGESGVGKEMFARAIQGSSDRAGKPFIVINCGALPADLVESILFGHVKGAFTGASSDQPGKFREAHGGTLFLDEVGELPPAAQVKLLRALQDGEIEPVGASKSERVNVRVISATNRRLLNMTKEGLFREDLYYRLNVFPVYVPPLRNRKNDIEPLARHFCAAFAAETGKPVAAIAPDALALLQSYDWPGNIRQLENAIYRATVLAEGSDLAITDFPQISARLTGRAAAHEQTMSVPTLSAPIHIDAAPVLVPADESASTPKDRFVNDDGAPLSIAELERELIAFTIEKHKGHMSRVARNLGIGRSTLYRKLKEYGLDEDAQEDAA